MSAIRTYKRILLALAVAFALVLVGATHANAWASIAQDIVGINVQVPSTAQQAPDDTGQAQQDKTKGGSEAVLGVNISVPEPVKQDDQTGTGGQTSGQQSPAEAILGINLQVPSTVEQAEEQQPGQKPTSSGSEAVLGINLIIQDVVPDPEHPELPGTSTPAQQSGAEAVLGINLQIPSTVMQAEDDEGNKPEGTGSEAVLGINLKVGESQLITFDANGGRGSDSAVPGPNVVVDPDESKFFWPGRHVESWHWDKTCTPESLAAYGVVSDDDPDKDDKYTVVPNEVLEEHTAFYAKWAVDDPRWIGQVELHLMEPYDASSTTQNRTMILDDEAENHGIRNNDGGTDPAKDADNFATRGGTMKVAHAGYARSADDEAVVGGNAPVYVGYYFPGGDDDPEGETLELPNPVMYQNEEATRDGEFAGWYRTRTEVKDGQGNVTGYTYTDALTKDKNGRYSIQKFDVGAGEQNTAEELAAGNADESYKQVFYAVWKTGQMHYFTFDANAEFGRDEEAGDPASDAHFGSEPTMTQFVMKVADGERATTKDLPELTRTGFKPVGWYTDPECTRTFSFNTRIYEATTVYAKWERNTYTVTFDAGDGKFGNAQSVFKRGGVQWHRGVAKPTDPTWYEHDFMGWFKDEAHTQPWQFEDDEETGAKADVVTEDTTLYAQWKEFGKHPVTFLANGGTIVAGDPIEESDIAADGSSAEVQVVHERAVSKPKNDPVRADDPDGTTYDFDGWFVDTDKDGEKDDGEEYYNFTTPVTTDDVVLTANWIANGVPEYDVYFHANGAGAHFSNDTTYTAVTTATIEGTEYPTVITIGKIRRDSKISDVVTPSWLPEHVKSFDGAWYTETGCTNEWDFASDTVQGETHLFAGWNDMYKVTFNANDGDAAYWQVLDSDNKPTGAHVTTKDVYVVAGETVAEAPETPMHDNNLENGASYDFVGWFTADGSLVDTDDDGEPDTPNWGTQWTFGTTGNAVTKETQLYAQWKENDDGKTWKVTADVNGDKYGAKFSSVYRGYEGIECLPEQPDGATVDVKQVIQTVKHGTSAKVLSPDPTNEWELVDTIDVNGVSTPGKWIAKFEGWFLDENNDGKWSFTDENGNGKWDDLVDLNGNGEYDEDEFEDLNGNGTWDEGERRETPAEPCEPMYYFNESVTSDVTVKARWDEVFVPEGTVVPADPTYRFEFTDGIDKDDADRPGGANDVADVWREAFTENRASGLKRNAELDAFVDVTRDELTGKTTSLFAIDEDGEAIAPHRQGYRFAGFYGSHYETKKVDGEYVQIFDEEKYFDVEYVRVPIEGAGAAGEPGSDAATSDGEQAAQAYRLVPTWVVNEAFKGLDGKYHWTRTADAHSVEGDSKKVVTLYAKWELRLDVTVPISVGVGANGNDQSILTPKMGAFQVKSRTVMPVAIDQIDLATNVFEMDSFFEQRTTEAAGSDGVLPSTGTKLSTIPEVKSILQNTKFWLAESIGYDEACKESYFEIEGDVSNPELFSKVDNKAWTVVLPVREDPEVENRPDYGFEYNQRSFEQLTGTAKTKYFTAPAFDIWRDGANDDKCSAIAMKLGLTYPKNDIQVVLFGEGDRTLSHLVFTVSANEYQKQ